MSLPTPLNLPSASERGLTVVIDGHRKWVACTEAAAMDGAHWANPGTSMSNAELIRLYHTGAHTANGGRTTRQIAAAIQTHYGHSAGTVGTWDAALTAFRSGAVIALAGDYHNLPSGLQRWDPRFGRKANAFHEVAVGPIAAGDFSDDPLLWWRDPLSTGGTIGEWVNWSTVRHFSLGPAYMLVFGHNAWIATPAPAPAPAPAPSPSPTPAPTPSPTPTPTPAPSPTPTPTPTPSPTPTPTPAPSPTPTPTPAPRKPLTYRVKHGDTLSAIGRRYSVHWQDIYAANRAVIGNNPNLIRPGQVLVIPGHYI